MALTTINPKPSPSKIVGAVLIEDGKKHAD